MQHDHSYYFQRAALFRGFARNFLAPNVQINHQRKLKFYERREMKSFVEFLRLVRKRRLIAELFNPISRVVGRKVLRPTPELPNRQQARSVAEASAAPVESSN